MLKRSALLIGITLLTGFVLGLSGIQAASTDVPAGNVTALIDAIESVNQNGGGTINLAGGTYTLAPSADDRIPFGGEGNNGLPLITADVTINGNGATIERADSLACQHNGEATSDEFRIFLVRGTLELNTVTLRNGCADAASLAANLGGAINVGGTLILNKSTLTDNEARGGAGIGTGPTFDRIAIRNSTIANNEVQAASSRPGDPSAGGVLTASGEMTIVHSTIAGNTDVSRRAGGLRARRTTIQVKNSILAGNVGNSCMTRAGSLEAEGTNLDGDGSCGFGLSNADPQLGKLTANGGPTPTMALASGSPAVDAAEDCTGLDGGAVSEDQRGVSRPQGDACDLGAFELK